MTDTNDIEALKAQNAELIAALAEATERLTEATARMASIAAPAQTESLTEQAQRLKAQQPAPEAPEGSLTRQAHDLVASRDARLAETLRRRAQGSPDVEPFKVTYTGLTAQATALRSRGH